MILTREFKLDDQITAGELHDIMMVEGAEVLKETVDLIAEGKEPRTQQNHAEFTYAPTMDKELGHVDFSKTSREIHNLVRGVNPWPSAYAIYNEGKMKIWKTEVLKETSNKEPGTILGTDKMGIKVSTGDGVILIKEMQMPNKKRMPVSEYIKGNSVENWSCSFIGDIMSDMKKYSISIAILFSVLLAITLIGDFLIAGTPTLIIYISIALMSIIAIIFLFSAIITKKVLDDKKS